MARSESNCTKSSKQTATSDSVKSQTQIKQLKQSQTSGAPIDKRKRLAANARERKRMNLLNKAYDELRKRLIDADNKSKYDVLVQAKEYIQALAKICTDFDRKHPQHQAVSTNCKQIVLAPQYDSDMGADDSELTTISRTKLDGCQQSAIQQVTKLKVTTTNAQHHLVYNQIQSPSSSLSGDCLSPMSLPESVASSTSSYNSTTSFNPFHHHHFTPHSVSFIKQEPAELKNDHHRFTCDQHYQSFYQTHQKQATL